MNKKDLEQLLAGTGVIPAPRGFFEFDNQVQAGLCAMLIAFVPPVFMFIFGIILTLFL